MPTQKRWQVVRSRPVQLKLQNGSRVSSVSQSEGPVDPIKDRRFYKAKNNGWIQPVRVEVEEGDEEPQQQTSDSETSELVDSKSEVSQPEPASGSDEPEQDWPEPDTDHEPEIETVGGVGASGGSTSSEPEEGQWASLDISERTRGVLESKGIDSVDQLRSMTDTEITDIKGIGKTSLEEIKEAIQALG